MENSSEWPGVVGIYLGQDLRFSIQQIISLRFERGTPGAPQDKGGHDVLTVYNKKGHILRSNYITVQFNIRLIQYNKIKFNMGSHFLMAGFRNLEKTVSDSSWSCSMWIKGQALESDCLLSNPRSLLT